MECTEDIVTTDKIILVYTEQSKYLKMIIFCRQSTRINWSKTDEEHEEIFTQQQAQIKQGWSLLATLHCVLLPDKVKYCVVECKYTYVRKFRL